MSELSAVLSVRPREVPPGVAIVARIHIRRGELWAELPGDFKRLHHCQQTLDAFKANHPVNDYEVRFHAVDNGRAG